MEPEEIATMLENHCDVGIMLIKSQCKVGDWDIKVHAWGYVLGAVLDNVDSMDRTRYTSEAQYRAFDAALMRAMITGKMLKDLLEDEG